MKLEFTGITTIAAAVGLALGSSLAIAQQPTDAPVDPQSQQDRRPAVEQRSERDPSPADQLPNADARSAAEERSQEYLDTDAEANASVDNQSDPLTRGEDRPFDSLAEQNPELSKFVEAVEAAGLTESLADGTEYTIFAPTNDALASEDIDSLIDQENPQELVALLRAHIVADDVDRDMAAKIGQAQTIDGGTVDISVENDKLMVGDAEAMDSEIEIGNVRVYAVDSVLPSNPPQQTALNRNQQQGNAGRDTFDAQSDRNAEQDTESRPQ